ncbi:hypothetical protein Q0N10_14410, partial [Staphylococcus aureus]|nr:hypothetical protein [Staphylococcus aureus]
RRTHTQNNSLPPTNKNIICCTRKKNIYNKHKPIGHNKLTHKNKTEQPYKRKQNKKLDRNKTPN